MSAPAGFGKTTLLAEWLASVGQDARVAWVSLDSRDNDPHLFCAYLVAAVRAVAGEVGDGAAAMLEDGAVVLYPVIRRHSGTGAVGFVASRVLEAPMIFVGVVSVLGVFTLRQDFAGGDESAMVTAAEALVAVKDWTFLLGPGLMPVVNALCLATVLYRARLVPRIIPTLGLIGAPILLASFAATLFGAYDQISGPALVGALPIAIWELSVGVWLTVKGFNRSPATEKAAVATAPSAVAAIA